MGTRNRSGTPLLDIRSYARRGPGERIQLSKAELEVIHRTVARTPEVMVKVLNRGGQDLKAIRRHLNYLSRDGEEGIKTDDGQSISGKQAEAALLNDWDLDLLEHRRRQDLAPTDRSRAPKLVYKLIFSMPPGTPPGKVLQATQNFAREQFALKHRYAMVLHTDEPHPHVHLVLKALGDDDKRLNLKKATLKEWRSEFARHLRELGVPANATERWARGHVGRTPPDGLFRAQRRGTSTHDLLRTGRARGQFEPERVLTDVQRGWRVLARHFSAQGQERLAHMTDDFNQTLNAPMKTKERESQGRSR